MNIGNTMKAIKVEALGGPVQPNKIETPKPVQVPAVAVTERDLVTV